jgi:hypothetical protein
MTGYKVVRKYRGSYWSVFNRSIRDSILVLHCQCAPDESAIKYPKNSWVQRDKKNGPFALFSLLKDAARFASTSEKIVSVEYEPSRAKGLWSMFQGKKYRSSYLPCGTIFADKIKILKEVKW